MTDAPSKLDASFDAAAARTAILARMTAAARAAGRDTADVTLTAVSKLQPEARVAAVLAAGQRVFGENRVQEALTRWQDRRAGIEPKVELRLIGPLQTNKAREAVAFFDVIETLDRPKLAADPGARDRSAPAAARASTSRSTPARSRRRPASSPAKPTPSSPAAAASSA